MGYSYSRCWFFHSLNKYLSNTLIGHGTTLLALETQWCTRQKKISVVMEVIVQWRVQVVNIKRTVLLSCDEPSWVKIMVRKLDFILGVNRKPFEIFKSETDTWLLYLKKSLWFMVCRMYYREWRTEVGSQLEGFYRILEEKLMKAQPRLVAIEKVRSDHTLAVFRK